MYQTVMPIPRTQEITLCRIPVLSGDISTQFAAKTSLAFYFSWPGTMLIHGFLMRFALGEYGTAADSSAGISFTSRTGGLVSEGMATGTLDPMAAMYAGLLDYPYNGLLYLPAIQARRFYLHNDGLAAARAKLDLGSTFWGGNNDYDTRVLTAYKSGANIVCPYINGTISDAVNVTKDGLWYDLRLGALVSLYPLGTILGDTEIVDADADAARYLAQVGEFGEAGVFSITTV